MPSNEASKTQAVGIIGEGGWEKYGKKDDECHRDLEEKLKETPGNMEKKKIAGPVCVYYQVDGFV